MRDVIGKIVHSLESGAIDIDQYAPNSCDTCIHRKKSVNSSPCNRCSTATSRDGRDYKPTDHYFWSGDKTAKQGSVKSYHQEHGKPSLEILEEYAPQQCINPACRSTTKHIHARGLCRTCYEHLKNLVDQDTKEVERWVLMYWLCDSEKEREVVRQYFLELYSWDRFEQEGRCLPVEVDGQPQRELILYYRQVRVNQARRPHEDPTPTLRQLKKTLTPEQLEKARRYLVVKGVSNAKKDSRSRQRPVRSEERTRRVQK